MFQVRLGENITVPCYEKWNSRYQDATFTWIDHIDRGAARGRMVFHGDGTMEIIEAELSDTDTYKCMIHLPGNTEEDHTHSVVGN